MNIKRGLIILAGIVASALLIAGGFALSNILKPRPNPIPMAISKQLEFSPLVIPANVTIPSTSNYQYNHIEDHGYTTKIFQFDVKLDDASVHVTEQPQSSRFTDIPNYRDRFLETVIQQTTSVPTSSGVIYIGSSELAQNKQIGVMVEKGLEIYMLPSKTLDQKQWRTIGDALDIVKPTN
jgi:hypothetical protein